METQGTHRRVRSSTGRRRLIRRLTAYSLIVLVIAGLAGGSYLGYLRVRNDASDLQARLTGEVERAQATLETGKTYLTQANTKHDGHLASNAVAEFAAAKAQFEAVAQDADSNTLLRYLETIPSFGQSVRSKHVAIDLVADLGAQLSDAGIQLATLDGNLIKPKSSGTAGITFLTVIDDTTKSLAVVKGDLIQAQSDVARIDLTLLPAGQRATLVKARSTIDSAIAALNEFARLSPILVEILGGNGARTYLIEQVNPAELRAGGGFIGSYSLIRADHGRVSVIRSGNAYDLADPRPQPGQAGFIPQPTPLRDVIPSTSWSFVDSNIYPDFPPNAKAAMQFVQPRVGKVDGVISFDYYTVASLLELTGPIAVPGYGVTVSATNFVPTIIKLDVTGALGHKTMLAALAGILVGKVSALPAEQWPNLITMLNGLTTQRHLQAYFTNANVEKEMDRVGWSGILNPTKYGEFFMEVEDNYFGEKDNYYITRNYTITLNRNGNVLQQSVTVDLVNHTPPYLTTRTQYRSVIRLFVSGGMSAPYDNLRRPVYADPVPPLGFGLINGWIYVDCCGGTGHAVLGYSSPWAPDGKGNEQIYWQKQPGTINDSVTVVWSDGSGQTFRAKGDLGGDRVITIGPKGVTLTAGEPGQATLPSLSLG